MTAQKRRIFEPSGSKATRRQVAII